MRIYSERYIRDRRRYDLAMRLIAHEVRTRTIARWTGLPPRRVRSARCSYAGMDGEARTVRHRGPSPTKAAWFLQRNVCSEAAALAALCLACHALPPRRLPNAWRELPSPHYGESCCTVYEFYAKVITRPRLSLERLLLLDVLLAQGTQLQAAYCVQCERLILIDPMGAARRICVLCKGRKSRRSVALEALALTAAQIPLICRNFQLDLDLPEPSKSGSGFERANAVVVEPNDEQAHQRDTEQRPERNIGHVGERTKEDGREHAEQSSEIKPHAEKR